MSMKAGTSGWRGPSVRAITAPMCGAATRLRRHVAGVPVILMPRVQDEAQVAGLEGADERAVVHHPGDVAAAPPRCAGRPRVVGMERKVEWTAFGLHAALERRVFLGVPRFRGGLAAGHPQEDQGVGGRGRALPAPRRAGEVPGRRPAPEARAARRKSRRERGMSVMGAASRDRPILPGRGAKGTPDSAVLSSRGTCRGAASPGALLRSPSGLDDRAFGEPGGRRK